MPHIIVKWYPGRTKAQKEALAEAITREVVTVAGCAESSVSVAIEEVAPEDWAEAVYRPDILGKENNLVRKPGYNPFVDKS
ncbi:MAG: tautomerase family protein [Deltaproteobacteria bacterium]|jgi:4-oxalocrotonate tautomerase|nr:tautomerase family protein [Deltaproteobacteria bacterium]